jgi:signal transduction histidine kinase
MRMQRRHWPTVLGVLAVATLAWYLLYTELLVRQLRHETAVQTRIYARILGALNDPRDGVAEGALLDLSETMQQLGIPIVLTDEDGVPTAVSNVPFMQDGSVPPEDANRVGAYARQLARSNPPIVEPGLGTVLFGEPLTVRRLRWIPWLQVSALVGLLGAAAWVVRHNQRTERDRIWAAMARETAHQMGTPLSSLVGWIEILRLAPEEREQMASLTSVVGEMEADVERLEKVSRRFEWIGRPLRREPVDVRSVLGALERYVRVRLPQLARNVELKVEVPAPLPPTLGNAVLLEWALENLVKNALDALAEGGGSILIRAEALPEDRVAITVADNGPGVPAALRSTLFLPGVSSKASGWGVGLSLARRIVEDAHGGKLTLAPSERGAKFVLSLPAVT